MNTEMLQHQYQVLHLEDNEDDHLLVKETLKADGLNCIFTLARSKAEFIAALGKANYDLIISDFSLPSYDGITALAAAHEQYSDIPFIFFSGTIGEEVAVDSLKYGAVDYVLKQRPSRLVASVRRALNNAAERARLRASERALRESEERFRVVARATNDVVWDWDMQKKQVWVSGNFEAAFGHPIANAWISSDEWFNYIHPDDKGQVTNAMASLIAYGNRVWWSEHRLRRADGSYAYIFDRASVLYDSSGKPQRMVGVKIDMSDRKEAEEKIHEQAALLDKATDAIIVCTLDHEITYWNQGAERIYGWSDTEAVGQNLHELLFPKGLPVQLQEAEKNLEKTGEWKGELPKQTKSGQGIVVNSRRTLIRDRQQRPKSVLIIDTDITDHKQLEEQFLRSQRQESLGSLVSGIAHDLNNALMPILMGVEILETEPLSADASSMVHTMRASAKRSAEMVKQMLLFARGGETTKSIIRPDQLVKEMGKIINDTFPKSIKCLVRAEKDLHPMFAISTQIHQVLMNLCVNARDAMAGEGTLTVAVENQHLDQAAAAEFAEAREGDFVCFSVADTGAGIPTEQLEKIFQPFFTTKEPGKGTGLGLSTCLGIVKKHDGFITVTSKVDSGTEFKVYLPAIGVKPPEQLTEDETTLPAGRGEGILVIDDEESILAMTRAALENFGYVVSTASTGMEAITHFRGNPNAFNLVITDQIMPLVDGVTTVAALRKIRPDIKVIVASGAESDIKTLFQDTHIDGFIAKPFTAEKMLSVVNQTLTSSAA